MFLFYSRVALPEEEVPQQEAAPQTERSPQAETVTQPYADTQAQTAIQHSKDDADISRELSEEEKLERNFKTNDAYLDHYEAIRSKQYVRRAILSSVITATNKIAFDRIYLNHLLGFHAIYQKSNFAKYVSGVQGLSVGYVSKQGHAIEAGMEFSSINNIFAGYRYFFRPENFLIWPFAGGGVGYDVGIFKFGEGPLAAQTYAGAKQMLFGSVGVLVPLVDVALKAEVRACAYGGDRYVLTQGIGAILFF